MPDDPPLGEVPRGVRRPLGMIEEYPSVPKHRAGFAGAVAIIDSDSLLTLLDRDPRSGSTRAPCWPRG